MLTHPTREQPRQLTLDGMAFVGRSFHWKARRSSSPFAEMSKQDDIADLSHVEWLGLLVEREIASRNTRRF